jgi:long-chain acyl-CoA synthetase
VLKFLKVCFCAPISEGYGQTESTAAASLTWTKDPIGGHVGAPYPVCDFKLVDIPDMKYTSEDKDAEGNPTPRGEICFKGYNCFKGYYNDKVHTEEAIDKDGWVHTGDVGQILAHGGVKIIDRKKNLFKLSQGEYIVPEKLENKFTQSPFIQQIFVYGDSLQNNVVGIVVPEKDVLVKWATEKGLPVDDYEELIKNEQVYKLFEAEIKAKAKEAGFFGFEIPYKLHLTSTVFAVENDLLTPTFKLKRNEAKAYFLS